MSNRSERREAERLVRKAGHQELRQQQDISPAALVVEDRAVPSYNATRHGCCALDVLILPTESIADFHALEAAWHEAFQPKDSTVNRLVDQLIAADWLYQRSVRTLAEVEAKIYAAQPDPMLWDDAQHKALTRFERYRTANQNAFNKARKNVEHHLKSRAGEVHKEERLNIAKSRLQIYELKNKPEPEWDEIVANMRKKSSAT